MRERDAAFRVDSKRTNWEVNVMTHFYWLLAFRRLKKGQNVLLVGGLRMWCSAPNF